MGAGMGSSFVACGLALISVIGFIFTWHTAQKKDIKDYENNNKITKNTETQQNNDNNNKDEDKVDANEYIENKGIIPKSSVELGLTKEKNQNNTTTSSKINQTELTQI